MAYLIGKLPLKLHKTLVNDWRHGSVRSRTHIWQEIHIPFPKLPIGSGDPLRRLVGLAVQVAPDFDGRAVGHEQIAGLPAITGLEPRAGLLLGESALRRFKMPGANAAVDDEMRLDREGEIPRVVVPGPAIEPEKINMAIVGEKLTILS